MTLNLDIFLVYDGIFLIQHVSLGHDSKQPISGEGIVYFMTTKGDLKEIKYVLHVPSLTKNLFFVRKMIEVE
jgi:hypothetical protein